MSRCGSSAESETLHRHITAQRQALRKKYALWWQIRTDLDGLSLIDPFFVSKTARDYPVNELSRTQWTQEPSTQSPSPLPAHSTLPIFRQGALRALACLSGPNALTVRRGVAHRDRGLSH